jgi:hypothetical protein
MPYVNKFNIAWQVMRVKAKKIEGAHNKGAMIIGWLVNHPTYANYKRVHNWLRMLEYGYRIGSGDRKYCEWALKQLEENKDTYNDPSDSDHLDFRSHRRSEIYAVLMDLRKRKNNFQFLGRTPVDQQEFMDKLEQYIREYQE